METRRLGPELKVSALGIGCMPMAGIGAAMYGQASEAESIATIQRAIDLGVSLFDTAEVYGPFTNEELLAQGIKGRREKVVIATKFGFRIEDGRMTGTDSTPANIRRACEGSLKRLGVEVIDLYYQHRVDPAVPIEETVGAMAELVREGKVRFLGLSEASEQTVRRAHATHPIAALQTEYSLWERTPETLIFPTLRELGIGFVPYSPLGRGFLTGTIASREALPDDDFRRIDPRYAEGNFDRNMRIVDALRRVAERHGVSPARVALAWLLAQGDFIVPIPGAKRRQTMEDSMAAAELMLSPADLAELDEAAPAGETAGDRYRAEQMRAVNL